MASLSNPTFRIDILTGLPNDYWVTGTVNVEFSPFETFLVNAGFSLQLQSSLWGEDYYAPSVYHWGGGPDDHLFSFPAQNITAPGTYRFSAIVRRGVLDEDSSPFDERDEVYNKFDLVSGTNLFLLNKKTKSPIITGQF